MRPRHSRATRTIDWITFSLMISLIGVGLLMLYSVSQEDIAAYGLLSSLFGKQLMWAGACTVAGLVIWLVDWTIWRTFAYFFYGLAMLGLVAVLLFGNEIKGATSWFAFAGFSIQPSEFAKLGTALAVAAYLGTFDTDLRRLRSIAIVVGIMILPMGLILLQPDAGSALVFLGFLVPFYRAGLSGSLYVLGFFTITFFVLGLVFAPSVMLLVLCLLAGILLLLYLPEKPRNFFLLALAMAAVIYFFQPGAQWYFVGGAVVVVLVLMQLVRRQRQSRVAILALGGLVWGSLLVIGGNIFFNNVLQPHQQERINVWLQPQKADPRGNYYNVLQSKLAISSGGLTGKGAGKGTLTRLNYVPEQSTDFIFCVIGEEQGFIGVLLLVGLFIGLLWRLTILAERQRHDFSRYYWYGIAGMLFLHVLVNIGMTMGLLPIIGIPLPFISKGGSSLLAFTLMIVIGLKLDAKRFR